MINRILARVEIKYRREPLGIDSPGAHEKLKRRAIMVPRKADAQPFLYRLHASGTANSCYISID